MNRVKKNISVLNWLSSLFLTGCEKETEIDMVEEKKQGFFEVGSNNNNKGHGKFNPNSQTWIYIERLMVKKLDKLRKKNDTLTLNETNTASMRGRIFEVKQFLAIPEEVIRENKKLK